MTAGTVPRITLSSYAGCVPWQRARNKEGLSKKVRRYRSGNAEPFWTAQVADSDCGLYRLMIGLRDLPIDPFLQAVPKFFVRREAAYTRSKAFDLEALVVYPKRPPRRFRRDPQSRLTN